MYNYYYPSCHRPLLLSSTRRCHPPFSTASSFASLHPLSSVRLLIISHYYSPVVSSSFLGQGVVSSFIGLQLSPKMRVSCAHKLESCRSCLKSDLCCPRCRRQWHECIDLLLRSFRFLPLALQVVSTVVAKKTILNDYDGSFRGSVL